MSQAFHFSKESVMEDIFVAAWFLWLGPREAFEVVTAYYKHPIRRPGLSQDFTFREALKSWITEARGDKS